MSGAADILLRATLLLGIAWLAAMALRAAGASAATRYLAWLFGLIALLLLPPIKMLAPALPLAFLPETIVTAEAGVAAVGPAPSGTPWLYAVALVYLTVAAALLVRLLAGRIVLARLWRGATPAGPSWEILVDRLCDDLELCRPVRLRLTGAASMPMTWGTFGPKLLLPNDAEWWPCERRRRVLLHELAHVRRRDSFVQSAASLACALYWFHPAVWFAARRLRLEQEHAADDLVLAAGTDARVYARDLLAFAAALVPAPLRAAATQMAGATQLERRLAAILARTDRRRPTRAIAAGIGAAGLAVTLLVAVAAPISRVAPAAPVAAPVQADPGLSAAVLTVSDQKPLSAVRGRALRRDPQPPRPRRGTILQPSREARSALPAVPAPAPLPPRPTPPPPVAAVPVLPSLPAIPPTPVTVRSAPVPERLAN